MAVKFKVVKRKVLNGAEKDSVKNYAIAKTSGTRFIKLGDGSGTVLRQRGAIGRIW